MIKRILGSIFLIVFLGSLLYKMKENYGIHHWSPVLLLLIGLIVLFLVLVVYKILSRY
ncbi:MAG TPA: hypothetical protein VJ917_01570 [Saprospiraceae bacterium]|nr:hypothetical protein [Saprospiraceae bacterium]